MHRATVDEVRRLQLDLLLQLDKFFKENCIQYFAFAGTLLGAVRHKGFIPWDNDIDVAVSRADYQKMQILLKDEEANNYFRFLCYENDPNYLWQHGRITNKKTYMKTARGYEKLGLSIDIFPLDSQGNDYQAAVDNLSEIKDCVSLRIMAYNKKYKNAKYPESLSQDKLYLLEKFNQPGCDQEEYWVSRHIDLAKKFIKQNDSIYYGCNSNDKYTVVCKRDWYKSVEYLPFENTTIPVPVKYDLILKEYYHDYMKLPPKNKQIGAKEMEIYILD